MPYKLRTRNCRVLCLKNSKRGTTWNVANRMARKTSLGEFLLPSHLIFTEGSTREQIVVASIEFKLLLLCLVAHCKCVAIYGSLGWKVNVDLQQLLSLKTNTWTMWPWYCHWLILSDPWHCHCGWYLVTPDIVTVADTWWPLMVSQWLILGDPWHCDNGWYLVTPDSVTVADTWWPLTLWQWLILGDPWHCDSGWYLVTPDSVTVADTWWPLTLWQWLILGDPWQCDSGWYLVTPDSVTVADTWWPLMLSLWLLVCCLYCFQAAEWPPAERLECWHKEKWPVSSIL